MNIRYKSKDFFNLAGHTILGIDLITWVKLQVANIRCFDLRYLPKMIALTGPIVFSAPFQIYERIRHNRRIRNCEIKRPVFIIGHLRSGTTFLHELLCTDEQFGFCSTNQAINSQTFLTLGRLTRAVLKNIIPENRPMDKMALGIDRPQEEEFGMANLCTASWLHGFYFPRNMRRYFKRYVVFQDKDRYRDKWLKNYKYLLQKLQLTNPGKTLILKSPGNTARIKEILTLFPDARFVHIHRNPYDVYRSTIHLFETLLPLLGFHHVNEADFQSYILDAYYEIHYKFLAEKDMIPHGQLFEINFNAFIADPMIGLSKIYSSLNLSGFQTASQNFKLELQQSANYEPNVFDPTIEKERQSIYQKWKLMFEAYDYVS